MNRKNAVTLCVFSAFGMADAAFLVYQYMHLGAAPLCGVGGGCYAVLSQPFFSPAGVFMGWIGIFAYLAFLLAGGAMWLKLLPTRVGIWLDYAAFAGLLFAGVLLAVEFLWIKRFCLSSVLAGLFVFAVWHELAKSEDRSDKSRSSLATARSIVIVSATVIVLISGLAVSWLAFQRYGEPGVVATIGWERITRDEMRQSPLVYQAERRLYEAEHDWLSQRIQQALLQREAAIRGVGMEHLVEEEKSVAANDEARSEFFQKLADKHGVRNYLNAPPPPTFHVNTSSANRIGPSNAPVTIVEFGDLQCPFTARASETINALLKEYGSSVSLAAMDFPLPFHTQAKPAAVAARCAGEQGKFSEYRKLLFADQKNLNEQEFSAKALALGIDLNVFQTCERSQAAQDLVKASTQEGLRLGLSSTPTFFINGKMVSGAQPIQEFRSLINSELARQK